MKKRFFLFICSFVLLIGLGLSFPKTVLSAPPDVEEAQEKTEQQFDDEEDTGASSPEKETIQKGKEAKAEQEKKKKDNATYNKKEVKRGGVVVERYKYPLKAYKGVADTGKMNMVKNTILEAGNGLFWVNKLIYQGFDAGIRNLSSKDILNDNLNKVTTTAQSLWKIFEDNYLITFLVIGMFSFAFKFFKGNMSEAFTLFMRMVLVFVIATLWINNANFFVKTANNLSEELQGKVVKLAQPFTSDFDDIADGEEMLGTTTIMRNTYFNATVYRPFLVMNYGTTLENGTENRTGILDDDEERIDKLIAVRKSSAGEKELDNILDSEKDLNNEYIDKDSSGIYSKFGIGFLSIILTIALGIPFLILSLVNLFVQFVILAILLILPLSFAISILPKFANSGFSLLGKLATQFVYKAIISLFVVFALLIIQIIDNVFPATGVGNYLLNTILLSAGLNIMILKRNELISMATAGRVNTTDGSGSLRRGLYETQAIASRTGRGMKQAGSFATGLIAGTAQKGYQGGKKAYGGGKQLMKKFSKRRQLASETAGNVSTGNNDITKNSNTREKPQGKQANSRQFGNDNEKNANFTVMTGNDKKNNPQQNSSARPNERRNEGKQQHEVNMNNTQELSNKRKMPEKGNTPSERQEQNNQQSSAKVNESQQRQMKEERQADKPKPEAKSNQSQQHSEERELKQEPKHTASQQHNAQQKQAREPKQEPKKTTSQQRSAQQKPSSQPKQTKQAPTRDRKEQPTRPKKEDKSEE